MPMLADRCSSWPATSSALGDRAQQLAATREISSALRTSSSRIVNSSPPRRATVSLSRTQPRSRGATSFSSRSPIAWPSVSLISLKRSRSRNSTASSVRPRSARAHGALQAVAQQRAVGQAGQRVVVRHARAALLGPLALGDVARHAAVAAELALVVEDRLAAVGQVGTPPSAVAGELEVAERQVSLERGAMARHSSSPRRVRHPAPPCR